MIFKRRNKELTRIRSEIDHRMAEYHGEDIWDLRDFLMLLNIADHDKMGKSKAIIYAYKLGFINGKNSTINKIKQKLPERDDEYGLGR